jgi:uncharacterized protein DUF6529
VIAARRFRRRLAHAQLTEDHGVSVQRLESPARLLLPLGVALAIAGGLYAFGTQHVPDYSGTALFGRTATDTLPLKSWLATGLLGLAAFQLGLALWMYGRLPGIGAARPGTGNVHRAIGAVALLVSLPIAYHCAFAYGVKTNIDTRVAVHSLAGCFLYGAIAAKVIIVRWRRLPGWALPLAGGTLVALVAVLWYTSSLWYFNDYSLPSL